MHPQVSSSLNTMHGMISGATIDVGQQRHLSSPPTPATSSRAEALAAFWAASCWSVSNLFTVAIGAQH